MGGAITPGDALRAMSERVNCRSLSLGKWLHKHLAQNVSIPFFLSQGVFSPWRKQDILQFFSEASRVVTANRRN